MIGDSPDVRDALPKLGGQTSLVDAYLAATLQILALIAAAYAIQATLRLRAEETSGRAEPLLATAVSRTRWALSHAAIALAGAAALLAVAGVAAGVGARAPDRRRGRVLRVLGAALAQAPPPGCSPGSRSRCSALVAAGGRGGVGRARPVPRARPARPGRSISAGADRRLAVRPQPAAPGGDARRRTALARRPRGRARRRRARRPPKPRPADTAADAGRQTKPCQGCVKVALACRDHARFPCRHA